MKLRAIHGQQAFVKASFCIIGLALTAPFLAGFVWAQDQPKPQERVSREGELQTGAAQLRTRAPRKAVMVPERRPAPTPLAGKTVRMEDALKAKPRIAGGKLQPKIEPAHAEEPSMGSGEQKRRPPPPAKLLGTHLQLVLKVTESGAAEIVSAKDVPGPAPTEQGAAGRWVYAVFSGDKTVSAQGIADPFEMRSFAPPPGSPLEGQGHHIERATSAYIPVAVPNLTLKSVPASQLSVKLYRVKEGPPLLHVDPSVFQKLQQEQLLEMKIQLPANTLKHQIQLQSLPVNQPR